MVLCTEFLLIWNFNPFPFLSAASPFEGGHFCVILIKIDYDCVSIYPTLLNHSVHTITNY